MFNIHKSQSKITKKKSQLHIEFRDFCNLLSTTGTSSYMLNIHKYHKIKQLRNPNYIPNLGPELRDFFPSEVLLLLLAVDKDGDGCLFLGGGCICGATGITKGTGPVLGSHSKDMVLSFSSSDITFRFERYVFTLRTI